VTRLLAAYGKLGSVIAGFVFGAVGAVWSFTFVERLDADINRANEAQAGITREVDHLNALASEFFMANQQGDLIFILAQQVAANHELSDLIFKGNLLDRAAPVRNMIGALAIAQQLNYRTTYDTYQALNAAAREDVTYAKFVVLKQFEGDIIKQGQARVPILQNQHAEIGKSLAGLETARRKNRIIGIVAAISGNFLLLLANLFAKPED
jgi:hypothetical protein